MNIREYLKENTLLADGAMGTYYSELTGDKISFCEFASLEKPEVISRIHREYIEAGAKLIRTNTFSANTVTLEASRETVGRIIDEAYSIAKEAVEGKEVFIGCSIGPIHESRMGVEAVDVLEEYRYVADRFLKNGAEVFVFETFGTLEYLEEITSYIKGKNPEVFILTQFAVTMDGFTRKGISIKNLVEAVKQIDGIDMYGFNCGSGPAHLYKVLKNADVFEDPISVLPNASYPEIENGRMVYVNNPDYFADIVYNISELGAKIVGGCCGTTPEHIRSINRKLQSGLPQAEKPETSAKIVEVSEKKSVNSFKEKLEQGKFVLAVELDPPFDTDIEKLMESARVCKLEGIDLVTVADSPRAIARVDSMMVASKIMREVGIETIPHLCCRDKNLNAIKSGVLGAHIDGIRNILAITGDPILDIDKLSTKSVFNLNSYELINLISEMNHEIFKQDSMLISGALNLNVKNKDAQMGRLKRKVEKGAEIFFTQPIFEESVIEYIENMEREPNVKIMAGIMPIVSYKNALFLNNEVPGIHIPDKYVDMFRETVDKAESEAIGIDIAVDMVRRIRDKVDGLYFITPFGRIEIIQSILEKIR
ncbi:bifunctional homocysteine S-methyltransferase/5,10-methylenetetrahydrofolate reductase [Andreesenia angusta]|uniref:Bifunctional homocysteine S-methyltransferase/5,10-methylenetetrahydrofolate reductase n=1 Tax=Andreesenia angusta TaxID=39480 RepID=A0A1S1V996_9FIRM|nr:bifunctional homocysteine S-methyltransferase/methylenetetrahydrofolate reductase [Andreesenia angusta]OHW63176.1 bifunctional homocysteine S-methyltransferase/5,10-methylenetetrahydrofolate reductase [Andreesenia angusta]